MFWELKAVFGIWRPKMWRKRSVFTSIGAADSFLRFHFGHSGLIFLNGAVSWRCHTLSLQFQHFMVWVHVLSSSQNSPNMKQVSLFYSENVPLNTLLTFEATCRVLDEKIHMYRKTSNCEVLECQKSNDMCAKGIGGHLYDSEFVLPQRYLHF